MRQQFSAVELRRIEEISQNASRPERAVLVDGWNVGLSPAKAKHSRCVNAFYASTRSFEENLAAVRALYKTAGLPCVFRLTPFVFDESIDTKLEAFGCERFDPAHVQLFRFNAYFNWRSAHSGEIVDIPIEIISSPDESSLVSSVLSGDSDAEMRELATRRRALAQPFCSYVIRDSAQAAIAHLLAIREEHCVGVFELVTRQDQRGRGLGTALLHRALTDAAADGATVAYLQVTENNPARRLYERIGFETAYTYWYRQLPDL